MKKVTGLFFLFCFLNVFGQVDNTLIGKWYGKVYEPGWPMYTVLMTLDKLVVGDTAGLTDYSYFPCTASLVFTGNLDSTHFFDETVLEGTCVNTVVGIYRIENDSLQYYFIQPPDSSWRGSGRLGKITTSIENDPSNGISAVEVLDVYPNPTKGKIAIKTEKELTDVTIEVYNLDSKLILTRNYSFFLSEEIVLPEEKGIYFLKLRHKDQVFNKRLIKF